MRWTLFIFLPIFSLAQVDTVWARRWSSAGALSDWAYALAIDDSGFIYVTGTTENSGTNNDWTTIKYTPSGDTVWVRNFVSPGSYNERASCITFGFSGNLYLTGYTMSSGAGDYLTIKYRPNGDTAWTRRYNGTGNGYDFAHWVCVDAQENVYVTGYSRGLSYQDDIATVKYDSSGNLLWVTRINGVGNYNDKGHKVIADNRGFVYVVGYVNPYSTGTLYDYVTIKLNAETGDTIWVRTYNDPLDSTDIARDIEVDSAGNVYVTGSVRWPGTLTDIFTIKYDPSGNILWTARYNNPDTSGADGGYGIKVDRTGNVYVVGQSQGLGTGSDIVLIKYSPEGTELWVRRYDGPAHGYDTPSDEVGGKCVAMDEAGNIFVGGTSRNLIGYNDYVALMYDPNGDQKWAVLYDFSDSLDYGLAIAVHPNAGEVVLTGRTISAASYYDWGTVKFRSLVGSEEHIVFPSPAKSDGLKVFPNPCRSYCIIKYQTTNPGMTVHIRIFDCTGKTVKHFTPRVAGGVDDYLIWEGTDEKNQRLPLGVYFVEMVAGQGRKTEKLILLK
ncbi:MAG: SBBP repeat-containing protein [candidate division WOR-3 bacterium]